MCVVYIYPQRRLSMSETAGSMGIVPFRGTGVMPHKQRDPLEPLKQAYEKRRIVQQEMRKRELEAKGQEGELNTREALELASYKLQDRVEQFSKLMPSTICYEA